MHPKIGQVYTRSRNGKAEVVRVVAIADEWVEFRYLHGPERAMRLGIGRCKAKNFASAGWKPTEEREDYSHLDGATRFDTFQVLDTHGKPILRCSAKRAAFYLRKKLAREVSSGVLQFNDPQIEERIRTMSVEGFTEFFLEVKNDRCVSCGATSDLTRHHVLPKRHKKNVPQPWRSCLSNVLFVCGACHRKYEETPEPEVVPTADWQAYVRAWRDHFFNVLQPKCVPAGWDIISVKNLEALSSAECGARNAE
ncbi:MAG: HNH endonuclease [Planctomycetia bacterium]|nr:HNH endonuclease [Planctomycetia bacterium]